MKDKPTSFRFDDSTKQALSEISKRESRSVANSIEWLAKDYFKRNNLDWPKPETLSSSLAEDLTGKKTPIIKGTAQ